MKINKSTIMQFLVFFLGFQVLQADKLAAPDIEVSTDENTPVTILVIPEDGDDDDDDKGKKKGHDIQLEALSDPANGSVTDNEDGSVTYTPDPGFNGVDSFTYTLRKDQGHDDEEDDKGKGKGKGDEDDEDQGNTATGTITVTVSGTNDDPAADDQSVITAEDTQLAITLTGSDPDGDALTYSIASGPASGGLSGTAPNVTYTPDANFNGGDSFTFTVDDGHGGSATATVSITVTPVNDDPVITSALNVGATEDIPFEYTATADDVDGDALDFSFSGHPDWLTPDGATLSGTPGEGDGDFTFTVTVSDGHGGSASATVAVTINAVNDNPVADGQSVTTAEDTPVAITLTGSDPDGDALSFAVNDDGPAHGSLSGDAPNLTYSPEADFNGGDSFTFTVSDGHGGSASATVSITVTPVNDDPVAVADQASVAEDGEVIIDVLANDYDVDGDVLTVKNVTQAKGVVHINDDGSLTYAPTPNFNGTDEFFYQVEDGNGGSAQGTVTVTVGGVNDAPIADSQSVTTAEDTPVDIILTASDPDGDALTFTVSAGPDNGSLSGAVPDLTYTPDANFNGGDSFTFTVDDGHGGSATATVSITVTPVNDDPVITSAVSVGATEDITFEYTATADDADGDALSFDFSGLPGWLTADGATVSGTPAEGDGDAAFLVTVSDGQGGSATTTVAVTVNSVNDAPVADSQSAITAEDTPVDITLTGSDPEGEALTFAVASGPTDGDLTGSPPNVTYTPHSDFNGGDSFIFTVDDGKGGSATATVTITVTPVNDAPVAVDDIAGTQEDVAVIIEVLENDYDVDDGDLLTVQNVRQAKSKGNILLDRVNGTLLYTPSPNFSGTDVFYYTIHDVDGLTDEGIVTVTVGGVNDAPVADAQSVTTEEDTPKAITLTGSDPDGDELTFTVTSGPANGSLTGTAPNLTYTPASHYSGSDGFTFRTTDPGGLYDEASVTVLVNLGNETVDAEVGPEGGEVSSQSGTFINIPAGALDNTVTIIIGEFAQAPEGPELAGVLYFYGPTGLQFNVPVTVTVPYDPDLIPDGASPYDLVLLIYNEGTDKWTVADSSVVNLAYQTVTGWITHFSGFAAGLSANQAPYSLMSLPDRQIPEDTLIDTLIHNLGEYFADRDGDQLTFAATTADAGLEGLFGLSEQKLIVVLTLNYYGIVHIEVTATDPAGASVRETLVLEILSVNDAPQFIRLISDLALPEDIIGYQMSMADIAAIVFDADGDPLSFSASSDTSAVTVATGDTSISLAPVTNWNGKAQIVVTALDGQATAQDTFILTIVPVNDLPTPFDLLGPDNGSSLLIQASDLDTAIVFTWETSSDPDEGDSVSYVFIIWQEDSGFELFRSAAEPELSLLREPVVAFMNENAVEKLTFQWEVGAVSGTDTTWNTGGPSSLEIDLSTLAVVDDSHLPQLFALHQNYPNPFNPVTTLHYELPMQAHVRLVIYDMRGREIIRLVDRNESAGFKRASWNSSDHLGRPVPTGIYFARLVTVDYTHTIKMTLIR